MKKNVILKNIFVTLLVINALLIIIIAIYPTSAGNSSPSWPTTWDLFDTDPNEGGSENNHRDVHFANDSENGEYLFFRLDCYGTPNFTVNPDSRYKWFIDLDNDIHFSGRNIFEAEYLLFVEDFNNDTKNNDGIGDVFLLNDTDANGNFNEWEHPPDKYGPGIVTDPNIAGYRIVENSVDLYINLSYIEDPNEIWYLWATDQENPNLDQGPTLDSIDQPIANDDNYTVNEGGILNIPAPGVLDNDYDDDGDQLIAILDVGPSYGTLTLNDNGSFSYVHAGGSTESDTFTYYANDGLLDSNIATVTINVTGVNDPPVADFSWDPDPQNEGSPVSFSDDSSDPNGNIVGGRW
jgi:VCBS repeat-containing protein